MRGAWLLGGVALAVAAAAGAALVAGQSSSGSPDAQIERGRQLYAAQCAACHGTNLEGQANWRERLPNGRLPAPPHDASGHTWHHDQAVLFEITKKGPAAYPAGYATDMPAFGDRLSDAEIAAILAFIRSTWPPEIRMRQPGPPA